jgi:hypothetical protein
MDAFLTKFDIARLICNQYRESEEFLDRMAKKLSKLSDDDLKKMANKAGFNYEDFGYNRFKII